MGFCSSTFKFFVFLLNFIFFLAGVAIIGIGAYMAIKMKDYFDFFATSDVKGLENVGLSSYVFIIVGVLVTVISFFGCCAACTDNKCMMGTFATLMGLILIAEVGVAVTLLVYKGQAKDVISEVMKKGMDGYGDPDKEGVTRGWDEIQETFTCCGVDKPDDWKNQPFQTSVTDAPDSCCTVKSEGCGAGKLTSPYTGLHNKGCLTEFEGFVENNLILVGGVGLAIIFVQLIAVITGCCLAKKMGDKDNYV